MSDPKSTQPGSQPVTLDLNAFKPIYPVNQSSSNPDSSTTLDMSGYKPLGNTNAQQTSSGQAPEPDHSILKDITGSDAQEWSQWADDQKQKFLQHPVVSSLKNVGGYLWGAVKGLDEMNPVGVQTQIRNLKDTAEEISAYRQARKAGKSHGEALQAADATAKQQTERENPLNLFKAPDATNSDPTESALYDTVRTLHGELAGRVAVAFKRALRSTAEDFKANPDEAAGSLTVKLLPLILSAGNAGPEEAEAGATEGKLSNLKRPSAIRRILKPEESARTEGAIKGESAIREATGVTDTDVPVRRAFGELSDKLKAEAKPTYQKMDQVLDGRWDINRNSLEDVSTALRRESDVDKLSKLKTRKADLVAEQQKLQAEAGQKGVSPEDMKQANSKWRQGHALEDLEKSFKGTVDAQDRVNLSSAIKKLKNFDDLDIAMGGKDNSARLLSRLEDELEHQQTMATRYGVANKALKYGGAATAGMIGAHALWSIVDNLIGK